MNEPWPLIKGVARIWPSLAPKGMVVLQCHFCLGLFESKDRRRCYCCRECRNAMHNTARRKAMPDKKQCPICHRGFTPRQENQRWCSSQCRKIGWYRRKKGQPIDPLTPLKKEAGWLPLMRGREGSELNKQLNRAQKLSDRRYDRQQDCFVEGPLKPFQNRVETLHRNTQLPDALTGRITEILASQTDSEKH